MFIINIQPKKPPYFPFRIVNRFPHFGQILGSSDNLNFSLVSNVYLH